MKLFFDPSIFYLQRFGGISRYIINLNINLNKNIDSKIIAPIYINNFLYNLKSNNKINLFKINRYIKYTRKASILFNKYIFEMYCKINKPNIVHLTYYDTYNYSKKIKNVLTVHDLIHEKYSETYNFKYKHLYKKKSIDLADKIICVSETTKKDLIDFYKVDENKISVIYQGLDESKEIEEIKDRFLEKPFILYVGDRNNYKNFDNLILAYGKSKKLKNNLNIVCFGGGTFSEIEKKFFQDQKINNNVRVFEGKDSQLNYLYKNAIAYICPSIYEGFGLTILEAMKMKCPIVASNGGSLKEIGKDVIDYFNPNDVDDIIFKIEKLVFDESKKNEMVDKYSQHLNNFSWKKTTLLTEKVYKNLI